jgi:hypothetical protein
MLDLLAQAVPPREVVDAFLAPAAVNTSMITTASGITGTASLIANAGRPDVYEKLSQAVNAGAGSRLRGVGDPHSRHTPDRLEIGLVNAVSRHRPNEAEAWTVPLPSRAAVAGLMVVSGMFTVLVYTGIIGVGWLAAGPILSLCAWLIWASYCQRRRVHD